MNSPTLGIDAKLGTALRRKRKSAGWSQSRLGDVLGVSAQQIGKYEKGADRISASGLFMVCRALGISPDDIFDEPRGPYTIDRLIAEGVEHLSPERREALLQLLRAMPGEH